MFIKIGNKGVRLNAMHINSIEPIEQVIEEKNGSETTHYGVRFNGTIHPKFTTYFFVDEEGREEFLNSLEGERSLTIPLEGKAASAASVDIIEAPKKGSKK